MTGPRTTPRTTSTRSSATEPRRGPSPLLSEGAQGSTRFERRERSEWSEWNCYRMEGIAWPNCAAPDDMLRLSVGGGVSTIPICAYEHGYPQRDRIDELLGLAVCLAGDEKKSAGALYWGRTALRQATEPPHLLGCWLASRQHTNHAKSFPLNGHHRYIRLPPYSSTWNVSRPGCRERSDPASRGLRGAPHPGPLTCRTDFHQHTTKGGG